MKTTVVINRATNEAQWVKLMIDGHCAARVWGIPSVKYPSNGGFCHVTVRDRIINSFLHPDEIVYEERG